MSGIGADARGGVSWLWVSGWALLFGLAYGQSPVFTSNSNTKWLQGLGHAGWGDLAHDPMLSTSDPFPLFSGLAWVVGLVGHPYWFHGLYVLLMGVYFVSVWWLGMRMLPADWAAAVRSAVGRWWLPAVLVATHARAVRVLLWRFDVELYQFPPPLAWQSLMNSDFAPASFGVLIVAGIALCVARRWWWGAALIGLASAVHATYFVSCLVLATTIAAWVWGASPAGRVRWVRSAGVMGWFALTAVPQMVFLAVAFGGDPLQEEANAIMIFDRIPHHSLPSYFIWQWQTAFVAASIVLGAWLSRGLLRTVVIVGGLFVGGGVAWCSIFEPGLVNLVAPWRASAWLVPVALAPAWAWGAAGIQRGLAGMGVSVKRLGRGAALGGGCLAAVLGVALLMDDYVDREKLANAAVIAYAAEHSPDGSMYLVPPEFHDFRMRTKRAIYVSHKTHPIKGAEVLAWYERLSAARDFYDRGARLGDLNRFAGQGVTHAVIPLTVEVQGRAGASPATVYRDADYAVVDLSKLDGRVDAGSGV
ncbi:MAG: DUF6798 domain-containing protein [Planctomycetota bacterium]